MATHWGQQPEGLIATTSRDETLGAGVDNAGKEDHDTVEPKLKVDRPAITGTPRFMSLALKGRPVHQAWHDLESFLYLLCYVILRYCVGVTYIENGTRHDVDSQRTEVLKMVFPDADNASDVTMKAIEKAKRDMLEDASFRVKSNHPLSVLANSLIGIYRPLHGALQTAYLFFANAQSLYETFGISPQIPHSNPYSVRSLEELKRYPDVLRLELKSIQDQFSHILATTQSESGLEEDAKETLGELELFVEQFAEKVLGVKQFPTNEHIISLFEAAASSPELNLSIKPYDYIPPLLRDSSGALKSRTATIAYSLPTIEEDQLTIIGPQEINVLTSEVRPLLRNSKSRSAGSGASYRSLQKLEGVEHDDANRGQDFEEAELIAMRQAIASMSVASTRTKSEEEAELAPSSDPGETDSFDKDAADQSGTFKLATRGVRGRYD